MSGEHSVTGVRRQVGDAPWQGDVGSFRARCLAELHMALAGYPNGSALVGRIERTIPNTVERPFRSLAEIAGELRPVQWLWPNWLPLGMITLLAAKPGTGKSLIALDLAHRIITGQPWPDGTPQGTVGPVQACTSTAAGKPVIYIDGENIPEVHNERAQA